MSTSASPKLYWIAAPELAGRIAISSRPRGFEHLSADVEAWRAAGVEIVVSMLPEAEAVEAGLSQQAEQCRQHGIEFRSIPIDDYGIPTSMEGFLPTIAGLASDLERGRSVAFHCFAGLGRSPTAAACTLVASGVQSDDAIGRITAARGQRVPETPAQVAWIKAFRTAIAQGR